MTSCTSPKVTQAKVEAAADAVTVSAIKLGTATPVVIKLAERLDANQDRISQSIETMLRATTAAATSTQHTVDSIKWVLWAALGLAIVNLAYSGWIHLKYHQNRRKEAND